jgi:hypothetical protein
MTAPSQLMAARPRITGHRLALQHASIPGSVTYFIVHRENGRVSTPSPQQTRGLFRSPLFAQIRTSARDPSDNNSGLCAAKPLRIILKLCILPGLGTIPDARRSHNLKVICSKTVQTFAGHLQVAMDRYGYLLKSDHHKAAMNTIA